MEQYNVTGMSCAACSARVEKAVSAVPGVISCSVSLLTNAMGVEGTASAKDIIAAVEKAGYGASLKGQAQPAQQQAEAESALVDRETPKLRKRLIVSLCFLLVLMYVSMGHMMWGFPLPAFMADNHVAMGLTQLLLAAIVMIINQRFFVSGFKSLARRAPNMDTLVAMGSAASFVWSTAVLYGMTAHVLSGDEAAVMKDMHSFYFESAAMILTLITVGKMLEARAKGRTTDALKGLMRLAPKTAVVLRDGQEVTVPVSQVQPGDLFAVRPGESVPVDGVVVKGEGAVDESALTGESIPVDKAEGDAVSAATINKSGYLTCRATRVGADTTLSQIIRMVSDAAATKAPIAKIADRVSGVFVPAVIGIALVTLVIWLIAGQPFSFALSRAIAVLVISCPCALGLATPVAIMVGSGVGAKNGILFKTAVSLEQTGKTQIVALDKTGTITKGEPAVTGVIPAPGVTEAELLSAAVSLEALSEHPLARAVTAYALEKNIRAGEVTGFAALPGSGLTGRNGQGRTLTGGSLRYTETVAPVPEEIRQKAAVLSSEGKTPLLFAREKTLLGLIAVADVLREESPRAIEELRNLGIRVVMLTGDNERTARAIGKQAGVDAVIAGVLPDGKEAVVRRLKELGRLAMVGDGINDAPALTRADTGIAIGAGTDVAVDAADVVLMKSRLSDVPAAVRLSRAVLRNIRQNLFWAFFYNVIGIPLAAGLYYPLFGWELSPMFGAAAMSLSSFFVVSNALRLNLLRIHDPSRDREQDPADAAAFARAVEEIQTILKEENKMTKTAQIKGMMCPHCEMHVKKALEALDGVTSAAPSHEKACAVIEMSKPVPEEEIKKAVEGAGYEFVSMD